MTVPKCTSWLGHKFKARYSLSAAVLPAGLKVSIAVDSLSSIYERFRKQTYECDICVRCGHVIAKSLTREGGYTGSGSVDLARENGDGNDDT